MQLLFQIGKHVSKATKIQPNYTYHFLPWSIYVRFKKFVNLVQCLKKITEHKITSHKLDVYTNGKLTTQKKLENVHGTNNLILNLLDVYVLQHNGMPKHYKLEHLWEKLNHYRLEL